MSLTSLALQTVLLILELSMAVRSLVRMRYMILNKFFVLLDGLLVHGVKQLHAELDVADERIASRLAEVLSDDNSQHLQVFGVWCHGICWHDP